MAFLLWQLIQDRVNEVSISSQNYFTNKWRPLDVWIVNVQLMGSLRASWEGDQMPEK